MADQPLPDSIRDHLTLALAPGLGPKLTAAVLRHFGSASVAARATAEQLQSVPQIGRNSASRIAEGLRSARVDLEWQAICQHGVELMLLGTPDYPSPLATIPDPPPLLYRKGGLVPEDEKAVALVGSRGCSSYGLRQAERIAAGLARAGWTVVSGLARGIDGAAHRGALAAGGRTIAVLAGGLGSIYPPEHFHLAQEVAQAGALLTETPMQSPPQAGMFPARNRIISGLSRAVVVIEAGRRSGALITVEHATEQGRDVFALPGNVDSEPSTGCLELIRNGARLVRSADDILEDLQGLVPPTWPAAELKTKPESVGTAASDNKPAVPSNQPPANLEPNQLRLWQALETPKHADELSRILELPAGELAVILMKMEMNRHIRRMAGNRFERR